MKSFVLCAGLATRLRPLTHFFPKSSLSFLNLPLLSYPWFYLELLGVKEACLNSYLFPKRLKEDVAFINSSINSPIKPHFSIEETPLGSGGGFYKVKSFFEKESIFSYINGDSLFFPSSLRLLQDFKEDFLNSSFESSFFAFKVKEGESLEGCLWIDRDFKMIDIGSQEEMKKKGFSISFSSDLKKEEVRPVRFTGLALFRNSFLKYLSKEKFHIFNDIMKDQMKEQKYKVFVDERGLILEAGVTSSYLDATKKTLECLFDSSSQNSVKMILEQIFARFDKEDKRVGLHFGQSWYKKHKSFLLAPSSVQGMEHLQVKDFSVIGRGVSFFGKSYLDSSVLGENLSWRGSLKKKVLV